MINVAKLSVQLKIGAHTILDFLRTTGFKNARLNTKLSETTVREIIASFNNKRKVIPVEKQSQVLLTENIFINVIQQIRYKDERTIDSYFTDAQAKEICSKMAVGIIRHYSNLFMANKVNSQALVKKPENLNFDLLRYQLHYLAAKALDFYGGKALTFIFKLRHLPLHKTNTKVLSANKKWYRNENVYFPTFQLNRSDDDSNYYIRFTKLYERKKDNYPVFTLYNYRRKKVAAFSRTGELIEKFKERFPSIAIFEEIKSGELTLYSGYDDGLCDICGRLLTDPLSVSYGRGPQCRIDYPL